MTGILINVLTMAMVSYSASPVYCWQRVRPWMATARMPADSAMRAMVGALRLARFQPVRNLSVTGVSGMAPTTASRILPTSSSSCISAEPAITLHTFLAGQPMLMSMIWAPLSTLWRAASAIIFGSAPAICTEIGATSPVWLARRKVLALPYSSEFDVTISETASPAPIFLHNWRKGRSVTPAIGATNRLLRRLKPTNSMGAKRPGRVFREEADCTSVAA